MSTFERPLKIGKIDNYTFTLSSGYLEGEVITSASVTTASVNLTVDSFVNDGVTISVLCSGLVAGDAELHYNWTTATRSGCDSNTIIIEQC